MPNAQLPERPSLEYLKKLAKERLRELRRADPRAKLATALLTIAREHGFSSWRALREEVERRQSTNAAVFFDACSAGNVELLRSLLAADPGLVYSTDARHEHGGWTGLHTAANHGQVEAVRLLLKHGADPNALEAGDRTYPTHWAAAKAYLEIVRALLDAGSDVYGVGDVHELDLIGWATVFHEPNTPWDVVPLLLERGARHHIFSAIAFGDLDAIRKLVEENPEALDRRMSRFEHGQTPLHFAISRKRYDILDLLTELGADLEAEAGNGQTALAVAMLRGDREAMRRLQSAGAKPPKTVAVSEFSNGMAKMADSIKRGVPMIRVLDIAATIDWYVSIGFRELGRYAENGVVVWGMVSFGNARIALDINGRAGQHDVSLWFETDQIKSLYELLKSRQIQSVQASLAGGTAALEGIKFEEDLYQPFYGGMQFSIRDPNGYALVFLQQ